MAHGLGRETSQRREEPGSNEEAAKEAVTYGLLFIPCLALDKLVE